MQYAKCPTTMALLLAGGLLRAETQRFTVTAVSGEVRSLRTKTSAIVCNPNYNGGLRCSSSETVPSRVRQTVQGNGLRFVLECAQVLGDASACQPLTDGDTFEAEYNGKTTMIIRANKGGNLGKPITVKYKVLDRRQLAVADDRAAILRTLYFDAQLRAEFPELIADSERVDKGLRPLTSLYRCTAVLFRTAVASDPVLKDSPTALLMAARQARTDLEAGKCGNFE